MCPSGTSRLAPTAATFTFDEITALPPPIAHRIGLPSIGCTQAPPCSIFAVNPDDCILAVGDGRTVEQLDEFGHETFAEFHTRFEQRAEIIDEASGEGVQDHRHADCARNWPRRWTPSSERTVSRILMILRILTITSSSCGPRGYCCTPFVLLTTA